MAKRPRTKSDPKQLVVFFATNRRRLSDAFDKDSDAPPQDRRLWLGKAAVEMLGDPLRTEARRSLLAHPEIAGDDDFADPDRGAAALLLDAWLDDAFDRRAVALVFIHGFANSFGSAIERAAQLAEFYGGVGLGLAPLAFSWPSDGQVFDLKGFPDLVGSGVAQYRADQKDATAAGAALARMLREVHRARRRAEKRGRPVRLALLAHSMGNLALSAGLAVMRNGLLTADMAGTFEDAVLVAADVPSTCLGAGQPLREIAWLARRVTVAISYDSTLRVASEAANPGTRRLGHAGPSDLDALPGNVVVVDCYRGLEGFAAKDRLVASVPGGGTSWDVVDHQYYRNDLKVRDDLAQVLAGLEPAPRVVLPAHERVIANRARHVELVFTGN